MDREKKSTRELIAEILKENPNTYISGQKLAEECFVTRAAVWKAIKTLKEEGLKIDSVTNRGYCLIQKGDRLHAGKLRDELYKEDAILSYYGERDRFPAIEVFDTLASTNDHAKQLADGKDHLIAAHEQTAGRGRKGRAFYSPKDSGLYFSLLLHPKLCFEEASYLTCIAAEAVRLAITEELKLQPSIKWMNDILLKDRKVAGILTESFGSLEEEGPETVVIGIGINLYPLPEQKARKNLPQAGSLLKKPAHVEGLKEKLTVKVLVRFYELLKDLEGGGRSFIKGYREHSDLIGKYVRVTGRDGDNHGYALVEGIDDTCRLLVTFEDGRREALRGAEVSVVKY